MEQIRAAFWAGLITFVVGAALLALSFFLGQQGEGAMRTLHNVLSLAGLLLAATGGLVAVCVGAVVLVNLLVEPRAPRRQS